MAAACVENIRVEIPIVGEKVISECDTVGDLRKKYPSLHFIKYTYEDPKDHKLKANNPSDNLRIVKNAYLIVIGNSDTIEEFSEYVTGSG